MLRRENGAVIIADPGSDKPILEAATVQCVHCSGHWLPQPGSGKVRGFCTRCNGPICGPGCAECVPVEQLLENYEKARPLDFRPTVVAITAAPPKAGGKLILPE